MVVYKSVEQFVRDMIKWAIGVGSAITDWSVGTPQRQIIEGAASECETVNFQIKLLEKASSMQTATGVDLEIKAGDYSTEKLTEQKSTTLIRAYAASLPGSPIDIPVGTLVQAKDGTNYETIASAQFSISEPLDTDPGTLENPNPTYDNYIHDGIPIRAIEVGESGDNGKYEINLLINSIIGIDGIINMSPAVGGFTTEDDERLRSRALRKMSDRSRGIEDAYESWVFDSDRKICANFQNDGGSLDCLVSNGNWQTNCFDGTYIQCDQFTRHDRILRVRAVGRLRGTGTVNVFLVADESGGTPPAWLIERVESYLAGKAPMGSDIKAFAQVYVNYLPSILVEKTEEFSGSFYNSALKTNILKTIVSYYSYARWNYDADLLLTDLREVIGSVRGVYDHQVLQINGSAPANVVIGKYELPKVIMTVSDITLVEFGGS